MRRALVGILLLAACSDAGFSPPTPGGEGGTATVPITGMVFDSVTGAPLAGVTVGIQGQFVTADVQGRYTADVAAGTTTISVATAGYEHFVRSVTASAGLQFDLPLRRLAPYPTSCRLTPQGFTAIVIDLQGRKSLERWTQSTLTLVTPTTRQPIGAPSWGYLPLDTYRWQISVAEADPGTTRVDWDLFDSQGDQYRGSCEPVIFVPDSTTS